MKSRKSTYIKLYRDIQYHEIWKQKPFSTGQAWIDLLLSANHTPGKVFFRNETIEAERGELITSTLKLSASWGWSRQRVNGFFRYLKTNNMADIKSDNRKTRIKILNYGIWQGQANKNCTTEKTTKRTTARITDCTTDEQQTLQQMNTNKNNIKNDKKNDKNIKTNIESLDYIDRKISIESEKGGIRGEKHKIFLDFVKLTEEEYQKLIQRLGKEKTEDLIDRLNNYLGSTGKKYKSHYYTILNWARREGEKPDGKKKWNLDIEIF